MIMNIKSEFKPGLESTKKQRQKDKEKTPGSQ